MSVGREEVGIEVTAKDLASSAFQTIEKNAQGFAAGISSAGARMASFGKGMAQTGQSLTTNLTLPVVGAGAAIIKVGGDFDTTLRQITALTGTTGEEIDGVRKHILSLSGEVGKTPQELADGFYFLASAGFNTNEALAVLDSTARASAVGLGTTADISKVVGSAINAFGKENLTAEDAVDQLLRAVKDGTAEAPDFANALGNVMGSAGQMGATFSDVTAAIAAMTLKGIGADEATTSLNQVFMSLLNTTPQADAALENLGLSAEGLRTQLREQGLLSVLQTLTEKFQGNDQAAADVFGNVRALRGILALTSGDAAATAQVFDDVAKGTQNLGDAFKQTEGPGREMDRAMAEAQATLIDLSTDVLPIVVKWLHSVEDAVKKGLDWWHSLDDATQKNIIQFAGMAAAIGPLLLIFGKLTQGVGNLIKIGGDLIGLIPRLIGFILAHTAATEADTVAVEANNTSLLTNIKNIAASQGGISGLATKAVGAGAALGIFTAGMVIANEASKGLAAAADSDAEKIRGLTNVTKEQAQEALKQADAIDQTRRATQFLGLIDTDLTRSQDALVAQLRATANATLNTVDPIVAAHAASERLDASLMDLAARGPDVVTAQRAIDTATRATTDGFDEQEVAVAGLQAAIGDLPPEFQKFATDAGLSIEQVNGMVKNMPPVWGEAAQEMRDAVAQLPPELRDVATKSGLSLDQIKKMIASLPESARQAVSGVKHSLDDLTGALGGLVKSSDSAWKDFKKQFKNGGEDVSDRIKTLEGRLDDLNKVKLAELGPSALAAWVAAKTATQNELNGLTNFVDNKGTIIQGILPDALQQSNRDSNNQWSSILSDTRSYVGDINSAIDRVRTSVNIVFHYSSTGNRDSVRGGGIAGYRAGGGSVDPHKMYEVTEGGIPEMLTLAGRSFLMMGATAGHVSPIRPADGGIGPYMPTLPDTAPPVVINNHFGRDSVRSERDIDEITKRVSARVAEDIRLRGGLRLTPRTSIATA